MIPVIYLYTFSAKACLSVSFLALGALQSTGGGSIFLFNILIKNINLSEPTSSTINVINRNNI